GGGGGAGGGVGAGLATGVSRAGSTAGASDLTDSADFSAGGVARAGSGARATGDVPPSPLALARADSTPFASRAPGRGPLADSPTRDASSFWMRSSGGPLSRPVAS